MGLYTIGLTDQQRGSQTGRQFYPVLGANVKDLTVGDEFQRSTLLPTGGYTMYTVASNDSNGTATIDGNQRLQLVTDGSAIGDDVDVTVSGISFNRVAFSNVIDNRSQIRFNIVFSLAAVTNTEGFIGIHIQGATLSALPTTGRHMGIFWDASAQANFILTSGNNSAQSTTDTGIALTTNAIRLEVIWNGTDSGTINVFNNTTDDNTRLATHTVTSLGGSTYQVHFFAQTETTAAQTVNVNEWSAEVT